MGAASCAILAAYLTPKLKEVRKVLDAMGDIHNYGVGAILAWLCGGPSPV
jgi:hypothetical protein